MAQGFDLRHLAICAGSSRVLFCLRSLLPLALLLLPPLALPLLVSLLPPLLLLSPLLLPLPPPLPTCCALLLLCPASPLCPSAAPALSPTACSWLGGWPRRMDLGTKECARGASWSNWWHSENDCLCAVYLSVLSPGVFCFAWLVLEAKNGVASVSGLYWPANGFMFSPNVLSLTME
mgnify:CR=1 FL=1